MLEFIKARPEFGFEPKIFLCLYFRLTGFDHGFTIAIELRKFPFFRKYSLERAQVLLMEESRVQLDPPLFVLRILSEIIAESLYLDRAFFDKIVNHFLAKRDTFGYLTVLNG